MGGKAVARDLDGIDLEGRTATIGGVRYRLTRLDGEGERKAELRVVRREPESRAAPPLRPVPTPRRERWHPWRRYFIEVAVGLLVLALYVYCSGSWG